MLVAARRLLLPFAVDLAAAATTRFFRVVDVPFLLCGSVIASPPSCIVVVDVSVATDDLKKEGELRGECSVGLVRASPAKTRHAGSSSAKFAPGGPELGLQQLPLVLRTAPPLFLARPRGVDAAAVPSQRTAGCDPFDDAGRSQLGRACVFPWCLDGACGGPVEGLLRDVTLPLVRLLPAPTLSLEIVTVVVVGAPDRGLATGDSLLILRCCDEDHLKRVGTTRAPALADRHGLWS